MAVYLKDLPNKDSAQNAKPGSVSAPSQAVSDAGRAVYIDQCAACHRSNGEGEPRFFPPLKGNANVQQPDPTTLVRVIVEGARSVPTDSRPTPLSMPAFGWKLSDAQIAAVASYVRSTWSNAGIPVSSDQVSSIRKRANSRASR